MSVSCSVYALSSIKRNYIYVGLSLDAARRIAEHQRGKERTTRTYAPFQVLLMEIHPDRESARTREKYLKSGAGKEFLRELRASLSS
jgi:putative endonuclease